jgi:hypothetical protein
LLVVTLGVAVVLGFAHAYVTTTPQPTTDVGSPVRFVDVSSSGSSPLRLFLLGFTVGGCGFVGRELQSRRRDRGGQPNAPHTGLNWNE